MSRDIDVAACVHRYVDPGFLVFDLPSILRQRQTNRMYSLRIWLVGIDAYDPVGGYYGLRKGYRGRFANYVAPVLEMLGLAELEHAARNNRVRAL